MSNAPVVHLQHLSPLLQNLCSRRRINTWVVLRRSTALCCFVLLDRGSGDSSGGRHRQAHHTPRRSCGWFRRRIFVRWHCRRQGLRGSGRVELGGPLECRRSGGEVPQQKMIVEIVRQKEPDNPKYPGGSGCLCPTLWCCRTAPS